ncbi:MAG: hypothetical protein NTW87_34410 [Planctomycetota bacterium]|nr:hypothetical protein [Planctomycetota bacterium]
MHTPSAEDLARTLEDLRRAQGSALVIGGLAVIYHGYERSTQDIDILYADADGRILERLKPDFRIVLKAKNGWHHLEHRKTGVRLELIPEGGLGTYGFIPGPKTVGGESGFISLHGLVWLKLVSGRSQDMADLTTLAKVRQQEFAALRERLPSELLDRFDEVLAQAKREMENDPSRLPDNHAGQAGGEVRETPARYGKRKRGARHPRKPARE